MTINTNRRTFLLGSAATIAAAGMGVRATLAQEATVRMFWWGSARRNELQTAINTLYEQHYPNIAILGETAAFNDYWPRLATQVAGGNPPDVINMDYRYLAEYGGRGVLLPLDQYVGGALGVADFGPGLDGGRMNGTLYAVPCGVNTAAMVVNRGAYEEVELEPPSAAMTWTEFSDNAVALTETTERPHYYGSSDGSGKEPVLEVWLLQRGKSLYTTEGQLGFTAEDATEWFQFWQDLRERGGCPPPDVVALDLDTFETGLVNTGYAALNFAFSSNLIGYQSLNPERLTLATYPVPDTNPQPGHYLKPAMLFSLAAETQVVEESLDYLTFLLTDPEATKIMGLERGVPLSPAVQENIAPTLDDQQREMLDFIANLDDTVLADLPPLPPQGAGEAETILLRISEEVGFGVTTPEAAGEQLVSEVSATLQRV
ncbi:ABC transporter substrate-binding protein [Devosia nitrariae]|uniref:ABC transporter ATP-binding protein n=1 Tax=Devosia nitrariae TaxID=2071872 RepID=A0ABQ5W7Z4_9HYPH|nr:ABC transporter substrate-binding protein [Devosia nitrariae]GLQ56158.1 ABC transporter ATP-binding protein [Devosia nitrariae]